MHITVSRSLTLLGIFTYFSTALASQQTSDSPQQDLQYNVAAEPTPSSTPSDTSLPTVSINQRASTDTEPSEKLPARNLGSGQEGFNINTYLSALATRPGEVAIFENPSPLASIFADPNRRREFLTPTTTIIVPASTVYYTVATVTVNARSIDAVETHTAVLPVSEAPPRTFQTITRASALASSVPGQGNGKRGFEDEKKACEALVSSEVLNCLETKGLLVPYATVTEVVGGATMVLVEVSVGAYRGRREARVTGRS
ncbi:hypothetical protein EAE96_005542 [Botrytis aclada]|nr:hypothetical protein EAE96_005542 [Botrytis aclada]